MATRNNFVVANECVADVEYCEGGYLMWKESSIVYRLTNCHYDCKDRETGIAVLKQKKFRDQIKYIVPKDDRRYLQFKKLYEQQVAADK